MNKMAKSGSNSRNRPVYTTNILEKQKLSQNQSMSSFNMKIKEPKNFDDLSHNAS